MILAGEIFRLSFVTLLGVMQVALLVQFVPAGLRSLGVVGG
jgi:hypothetical protein